MMIIWPLAVVHTMVIPRQVYTLSNSLRGRFNNVAQTPLRSRMTFLFLLNGIQTFVFACKHTKKDRSIEFDMCIYLVMDNRDKFGLRSFLQLWIRVLY